MNKKAIYLAGIIGVTFFAVSSILAGFLYPGYNHISQYISESFAVGTPYGKIFRYACYVPSGILLTFFSLSAIRYFPKSRLTSLGFWGLAIFYGFATIVIAIFPCDHGCNKALINPSFSQLIHNLTGLLTYFFVPVSLIIIGLGIVKQPDLKTLAYLAVACGVNCILFIALLLSNPLTLYAGLFQRIIEVTIIIWIIACSIYIRNSRHNNTALK